MPDEPIDTPFGDGRGPNGKFAVGNKGGPGNPHAASAAKHRAAFWKSIKDSDVGRALKTIRKVMDDEAAKPADRLAAARELLDRVVGKPIQADVLERIEALELLVAKGGIE
jgi:hypothetical protein